MHIEKILNDFTKDNIKIIKLDLKKELKGGYLCINKNKYILINSNLDEDTLKNFLTNIFHHLNSCTSNNIPYLIR